MTIAVLHKVLHLAGQCIFELVAPYEMGGKVVFRLPGTWVSIGHGLRGPLRAVHTVDTIHGDIHSGELSESAHTCVFRGPVGSGNSGSWKGVLSSLEGVTWFKI